MNMLGMKSPLCEKLINSFSPSCNENFHINEGIIVGCEVLFNGDTCYEIQEGDDTHTVCLDKKNVLVGHGIFLVFHANMLYLLWCTINKSQLTKFLVGIAL